MNTVNWRKYYLKNKARLARYNKQIGQLKREFLNRAKMKPCVDCGIQYNPWVMDFDHRDPSAKEFSIGMNKRRSLKNLQIEIDKCDVVCANCHRERTHKQTLSEPQQ